MADEETCFSVFFWKRGEDTSSSFVRILFQPAVPVSSLGGWVDVFRVVSDEHTERRLLALALIKSGHEGFGNAYYLFSISYISVFWWYRCGLVSMAGGRA